MTNIVYCDDWTCPARASCAHHFGRSEAYAAMVPSKTRRFEREAGADSCPAYQLDSPKPWLADA